MLNELKNKIAEVLIFFFIIFCLLCLCHVANKEALRQERVAKKMSTAFCAPEGDGYFHEMVIKDAMRN